MKAVLILSAIAGASAFAPASQSRSGSALAATSDLSSMRGSKGPESGGKIFDPLGLAEYAPGERLRKAELANGRSAMLATVGWVFPKYFGTFEGPIDSTDPIDVILKCDPQWWAQFIVFCGVIEGVKYRGEMEGKSYTGDGPAVIDWAQQWDKLSPTGKEDMAMKELKNGRLAMIGVAGFVANYFIPGATPLNL